MLVLLIAAAACDFAPADAELILMVRATPLRAAFSPDSLVLHQQGSEIVEYALDGTPLGTVAPVASTMAAGHGWIAWANTVNGVGGAVVQLGRRTPSGTVELTYLRRQAPASRRWLPGLAES